MSSPLIARFKQSDSVPMVASALQILATIAASPDDRHRVLTPWTWDLRQRARHLDRTSQAAAAEQARVIARLVGAVALGEIGAEELQHAARELEVEAAELRRALDTLEAAMHAG